MNTKKSPVKNRTWLAILQEEKCRHVDAIHEMGFINWSMDMNSRFSVGDTVFLFLSDEKRVRFKMAVVAENCKREDSKYWKGGCPDGLTYKLQKLEEYRGEALNESELLKFGFKGVQSLQSPLYNNPELIRYIYSKFGSGRVTNKCVNDVSKQPLFIVDLGSGRYTLSKKGHEIFNLEKNLIDNRYHGYCPPHDNINITELGAAKSENVIFGVTVVYTRKKPSSSDREIVAFCTNATVYRNGINNGNLERVIPETNEACSYTIESDNLENLENLEQKFTIRTSKYSPQMFRGQRTFKGKYPELDDRILDYISSYMENNDSLEEASYQKEINGINIDHQERVVDNVGNKPNIYDDFYGRKVRRNPQIGKQVLERENHKCSFNPNHNTFKNKAGVMYMEAHHLIPCTSENAETFWKNFHCNIDCEANIICLCPICHRRIHFGSDDERKLMIKSLYEMQKEKLHGAGIEISIDELYKKYNV